MTIEEQCRLSYYEKVTVLNEKHGVWMVKNKENGEICVMKENFIYNRTVYDFLKKSDSRYFPKVYDYFISDDNRLIVIEEFISGKTIDNYIEQYGVFNEQDAFGIIWQVCVGLQQIHGNVPQIIHRDLKPSNVMLTNDGNVKIIDFNAAKTVEEVKTQDTMLIGTSGYAAPEQYGFGQSDVRTDIYAAGVLLNFLCTGKLPKEQMADGKAGKIVEKCIQLEPSLRYQSSDELLDVIRNINADARNINVNVQTRQTSQDSQANHSGQAWTCRSCLPPGFRSGKLWKMATAFIGYIFIIYICLGLTMTDSDGSVVGGAELICMKITLFIIFMFLIAFVTNYLNIQKYFPFMQNKNQTVRIIAEAVWCLAGMFLILVAGVLVYGIIAQII